MNKKKIITETSTSTSSSVSMSMSPLQSDDTACHSISAACAGVDGRDLPWHHVVRAVVDDEDELFTLQARVALLRNLSCVCSGARWDVAAFGWRELAKKSDAGTEGTSSRLEASDIALMTDNNVRGLAWAFHGTKISSSPASAEILSLRRDMINKLRPLQLPPPPLPGWDRAQGTDANVDAVNESGGARGTARDFLKTETEIPFAAVFRRRTLLRVRLMLLRERADLISKTEAAYKYGLNTADFANLRSVRRASLFVRADVADACLKKFGSAAAWRKAREKRRAAAHLRARTVAEQNRRQQECDGSLQTLLDTAVNGIVADVAVHASASFSNAFIQHRSAVTASSQMIAVTKGLVASLDPGFMGREREYVRKASEPAWNYVQLCYLTWIQSVQERWQELKNLHVFRVPTRDGRWLRQIYEYVLFADDGTKRDIVRRLPTAA